VGTQLEEVSSSIRSLAQTCLLLLQNTSLESLTGHCRETPNQVQIERLESKRATVSIDQTDQMVLNA
jgi:hypothetical protein